MEANNISVKCPALRQIKDKVYKASNLGHLSKTADTKLTAISVILAKKESYKKLERSSIYLDSPIFQLKL